MSAACHTPDVIEMPYRPPLLDAGDPGEKPCTVRLGGPTCLAGDVMGDYSFKAPLAPGQRLVFGDMAIYTTCKNNTFNGMPLPDIWLLRSDGSLARLAHFGYQDFRCRLGGRGEVTLAQHLSQFKALSLPEKQPRPPGRWQKIPSGKGSLRSLVWQLQ